MIVLAYVFVNTNKNALKNTLHIANSRIQVARPILSLSEYEYKLVICEMHKKKVMDAGWTYN